MKNRYNVFLFLIILTSCALFSGCEKEKTEFPSIEYEKTVASKEGENCGGLRNEQCAKGLICKHNFDLSDAMGVCVKDIVNEEIECDQTPLPVCGIKFNQKLGFMNKCIAEKKGAEILYTGFCKVDETIANNCKAVALGVGNCGKIFRGYIFNGKNCIKKSIVGCEVEVPFQTLEDCQKTCM